MEVVNYNEVVARLTCEFSGPASVIRAIPDPGRNVKEWNEMADRPRAISGVHFECVKLFNSSPM